MYTMTGNQLWDIRGEALYKETTSGFSLVYKGKFSGIIDFIRTMRQKELEKRKNEIDTILYNSKGW